MPNVSHKIGVSASESSHLASRGKAQAGKPSSSADLSAAPTATLPMRSDSPAPGGRAARDGQLPLRIACGHAWTSMAAAAIAALDEMACGGAEGPLQRLARAVQASALREAAELDAAKQHAADVLRGNARKAAEALRAAARECEAAADDIDHECNESANVAEAALAARASAAIARVRAAQGTADTWPRDASRIAARQARIDTAVRAAVEAATTSVALESAARATAETAALAHTASERIAGMAEQHGMCLEFAPSSGRVAHSLPAMSRDASGIARLLL